MQFKLDSLSSTDINRDSSLMYDIYKPRFWRILVSSAFSCLLLNSGHDLLPQWCQMNMLKSGRLSRMVQVVRQVVSLVIIVLPSQWGYMSVMVSQIIDHPSVCLTSWSSCQQRKHQSSILLVLCVRAIHPWQIQTPWQRAINAECFSLSWRHHVNILLLYSALSLQRL